MAISTTTETRSASPATYGKVRYVPAGNTPQPSSQPYGLPFLTEFGDERKLPLHDLRPLATFDEISTAKKGCAPHLPPGFAAVKYPSVMHSPPYTDSSWHDPELLQNIYIPETQEMLKRLMGAKTVIIEAMILRNSSQSLQEDVPTNNAGHKQDNSKVSPFRQGTAHFGFPLMVGFSPAIGARPSLPKVHVDYAPIGARTHIRLANPIITSAFAPVIAAEDSLLAAGLPLDIHYSGSPMAPRWAAYSVWRPLKTVRRDPLAVGDMRSALKEDFEMIEVPVPTIDSDGTAQAMHIENCYVGKGREGHRWHYVSEQKREEVLIIRHWDSDREGDSVGTGGVMHSSVELEGQETEEPRESLELRCWAIW